jgi:hypothetical protein
MVGFDAKGVRRKETNKALGLKSIKIPSLYPLAVLQYRQV